MNVDLNQSSGEAGWWSTQSAAVPAPGSANGEGKDYMMKKEDAGKIIAFSSSGLYGSG
ncbi:hypothetical protein ACFSQ7_20700 [Paenibacillus rhizoplanae]